MKLIQVTFEIAVRDEATEDCQIAGIMGVENAAKEMARTCALEINPSPVAIARSAAQVRAKRTRIISWREVPRAHYDDPDKNGPVVNGEQFPKGYTREAAEYEQRTR